MKTSTRTRTLIMTAAFAVATGGLAAASSDPMPCQKAKLSAQIRQYQCLSRCEQRDPSVVAECRTQCEQRFAQRIATLSARPLCTNIVVPGVDSQPDRCSAQIVKVRLRAVKCHERCDRLDQLREDFDRTRCDGRCDAAELAGEARVSSLPHCDGLTLDPPTP